MASLKRKNSVMKHLKFAFLVFLMSYTSSKVLTNYDATTDFTKFKTFDFYKDTGEGLNEFDVKRISSAIQKELEIAGLKQNSKPGFFIYFDVIIFENISKNTIGVGLGGGGRNGGFGVSGGMDFLVFL
jgi:hypothetical protein